MENSEDIIVDDNQTETVEADTDSVLPQDGKDATKESKNPDLEPWFYEDGIPGVGDRPEWLNNSKYKSVSEQAKAYKELEKKIGNFKGAPKEEYKLDVPGHEEVKFEKDDPLIVDFSKFAKENNMSQDIFSKCLEMYVGTILKQQPNPQDEIKKLGDDGEEQIRQLKSWADTNFSEAEIQVLESMTKSAEQIRLFQKIRKLTHENKVANYNANEKANRRITEKQLEGLVADPRYATDPAYRAEVDKKFANFYG